MTFKMRRTILKYLTVAPATQFRDASCAEVVRTKSDYSDEAAADRWMRSIEALNGKTLGGLLYMSRFADPIYFVTTEIGWKPNPGQADRYQEVRVPTGFVTDFASIPRIFWSLLRPDGIYAYAAVVHDYLYWDQPVSRSVADDIFKFGMEDLRVNSGTIAVIYRAVRLGGGSAWTENARLKAAGERRILLRYPDDPTIRWEEWKQRKDVFRG